MLHKCYNQLSIPYCNLIVNHASFCFLSVFLYALYCTHSHLFSAFILSVFEMSLSVISTGMCKKRGNDSGRKRETLPLFQTRVALIIMSNKEVKKVLL